MMKKILTIFIVTIFCTNCYAKVNKQRVNDIKQRIVNKSKDVSEDILYQRKAIKLCYGSLKKVLPARGHARILYYERSTRFEFVDFALLYGTFTYKTRRGVKEKGFLCEVEKNDKEKLFVDNFVFHRIRYFSY